jgi:hypothetical protein
MNSLALVLGGREWEEGRLQTNPVGQRLYSLKQQRCPGLERGKFLVSLTTTAF